MRTEPGDNGGAALLGRLRAVALIATLVGAVGSIGLMLRAGHPPLFLRVLFVIWVLSPFAAALAADRLSKRWSVVIRRTLYGVMLVVALGSLAIYANDAVRPRSAQPAFVYVLVPPVAGLLAGTVVSIAALISATRSRRDDA